MVRFTEDDEGEPGVEASRPDDGLAPVIPLFAQRDARAHASTAVVPDGDERVTWRSTWEDEPERDHERAEADVSADVAPVAELAEKSLLKKLRGRSLSIAEARDVLRAAGAIGDDADDIVERFEARGYLDDAALAEQLIHVGVDRKGQGRRVIAQSLAKRGIPRDVADAALLTLPDDDRERALDYARSKARSLSSTDRDAALRRLSGQLARRGYGGSMALDVARQALDEAGLRSGMRRAPESGVRFVED